MFHVVGYVCGFTIASDEVPLDMFFTICLFISPDFDVNDVSRYDSRHVCSHGSPRLVWFGMFV